ncbi:hypothetical protein MD484_g1633, partial [Candolleomyces efflorescens]
MQIKTERSRTPKEERKEREWLEEVLSPRPSPKTNSYAGLGLATKLTIYLGLDPHRIPTVSHLIRRLEQCAYLACKEETKADETVTGIEIPDTDEEDNGERDKGEGPSNIGGLLAITTEREAEKEIVEKGTNEGSRAGEIGPRKEDSEQDSDTSWEPDTSEPATGSSDLLSVEEESLGYVTSEDGSIIGEVVDQAIIEASLEGLNITDDRDLQQMDRAKKRILLRNTDYADLRRLQRRRLIDETDVGVVLLDRLDQDLRRIGLNATSVLRLQELTGTLISGSFVLPVLARGILIPNDLDFYASLQSYKSVLSYLKKKGYTECDQIFPKQGWRQGYGTGLQDVSIIFELRNKKAYKINVIVSVGRPILPILQFHSTPVMNYIAHHGVVCLYDITVYNFGVANYMDRLPSRIVKCFEKYRQRGIEITGKLEEDHICKVDACCAQTVRSLFDRDVIHVRFPDFMDVASATHRKNEADIAIWRLATAAACNAVTVDDVGFVMCDTVLSQRTRRNNDEGAPKPVPSPFNDW